MSTEQRTQSQELKLGFGTDWPYDNVLEVRKQEMRIKKENKNTNKASSKWKQQLRQGNLKTLQE